MPTAMPSAYKRAGVDATRANEATRGLVNVLKTIALDRPSLATLGRGHYADVLQLTETLGIAVSMDGVGSKAIVAEEMGKYDTIGIDCIAMNVNDVLCVGAQPVALLDYISVQDPDPDMLRSIAVGLKAGAEDAGIEIPGGEVAQLRDMIQGHPDNGFDLVGACFGIVAPDDLLTGDDIQVGDSIIGIPSRGVHANGLTLARDVLTDLHERPGILGDDTVGETLLEPTEIYVRAIRELLASSVGVTGLAHITSMSFRNLLRLNSSVGFRVDAVSALPTQPIFDLIQERDPTIKPEDMWEVFNMGCGFCCIVPRGETDQAIALLSGIHRGTAVVGEVTSDAGYVELAEAGLVGGREEQFRAI